MTQDEIITHEDMANVAASTQAAFQTIYAQTPLEARPKISQFVARVLYQEKPYLWVSATGLAHVIELAFADDLFRDFVLSLQFHFFTRWGEGARKFTSLAHALSWGAAAGPKVSTASAKDNDLCAIPPELRARLGTREETQELLEANPWMVCLLLLRSYMSLVDVEKLPKLFADPSEPTTTVR